MSNNINEVCKRLNGVAGDLSMSRDRETTAFAKDILALLANHDRMQARVSELEAAPATAGGASEDAHVLGIIADKIEDGKLDHPGIYSNKALAGIVRKASNRALLTAPPGWRLVPEVSQTTAALIELLVKRDQAGRAKYGTSLDRTDLTHDEWLQHMAEELLDGAGYALAAKRTAQRQNT